MIVTSWSDTKKPIEPLDYQGLEGRKGKFLPTSYYQGIPYPSIGRQEEHPFRGLLGVLEGDGDYSSSLWGEQSREPLPSPKCHIGIAIDSLRRRAHFLSFLDFWVLFAVHPLRWSLGKVLQVWLLIILPSSPLKNGQGGRGLSRIVDVNSADDVQNFGGRREG